MTYLQLCVKLRERVASQGNGPAAVTAQSGMELKIVNWINEAYGEIQRLWIDWRFRWLEGTISTVSGTQEYAMPTTLAGWYKDAFYYDGSRLTVMPWDQYREERDGWTTVPNGKPEWIVIKPDNTLLLLPKPNAVYSIRYEGYKAIAQMAANADVPILPEEHHLAIVYKAMQYYGFHHDAPEVVSEGKYLYEQMLISLEASQLVGQEYKNQAVGNNLQIERP